MFKFVVLLALVPAIFATTGIVKCRDGTPLPDYVNVAGCEQAPCQIAIGTAAQMTLGFLACKYFSTDGYVVKFGGFIGFPLSPCVANEIETFTAKVNAGVGPLWVPYPLPADVADGCRGLEGSSCPISAGEYAVYNFYFPIEESYPKISVSVELSLHDAKDNKFVCAMIPVRVVA